jgi:NOL1/NOP2/fmu family ribosome biogenesis protein
MNLKILNSKQIKEILNLINRQWDCDVKLDYAFLKNETLEQKKRFENTVFKKNKIFIASKEIFNLDFSKLRINSLGLEFATIEKNNQIRLSIEGSQIIGPKAKKNIIELDEKEIKTWLKGEDVEKEAEASGFVIVKHNNDFYGTGKYKEKRILNFIPKERRIKESF